jgi:YbbR domain-containing protein
MFAALRGKVNKVLESRAFYIVFSVLASIALWVFVERVENKDIDIDIRVPVEFANPDIVADRRLVVTGVATESVTLRVSGKRGTVSKLYDAGAVRVTANLADIAEPGRHMLRYSISYAAGIDEKGVTVISRSDTYISVDVESAYDKPVPLTAKIEGDIAAEGYLAEPAVFNPGTVVVYGPRTEVERIASARVLIQRENQSRTLTAEMAFTPVDADGDEIVSDKLTFDRDTVSVTIPIRMIKEVALTVNAIYVSGATVENTVITIEPETVSLSGDAEALGMNSLTLATIDLSKFESFHSASYPILLPNGINNLTGATEAEVTISIRGLETKRVAATGANLQIVNETPGYAAELITKSVDVAVRGVPDALEGITAESVRVAADLAEYGETIGTFTVPAKVYIDGDFGECGPIGDYKVTVRVERDADASGGGG